MILKTCHEVMSHAKNDDIHKFRHSIELLKEYINAEEDLDKGIFNSMIDIFFKNSPELSDNYCLDLFEFLNAQPLTRWDIMCYITTLAESSDLRLFYLTSGKIKGYTDTAFVDFLLNTLANMDKPDLVFEVIEKYNIRKDKAFNIGLQYRNMAICEKFLFDRFSESKEGIDSCIKELIKIGALFAFPSAKEHRKSSLEVLKKLMDIFPEERSVDLFYQIYSEIRVWIDEKKTVDFLLLLIPEKEINAVVIWAFKNNSEVYVESLIDKSDHEIIIKELGNYSSTNGKIQQIYNKIKSIHLNQEILDNVPEKNSNKKNKII